MAMMWLGLGASSSLVLEPPVPHVRAAWRPDQFNRCSNPGFLTATTGWATTVGVNGYAGSSITQLATDGHSDGTCGSVVTTTNAGSGVHYDLGSDTYFGEATYGTAYAALVWLKWVSGSRRARIILGSEGTTSDRATLVIDYMPDLWTPYRVVWYPSADRTDAQLAITNGSAYTIVTNTSAAITFKVDDVSIYQLDAFSQVENGNFISATTGWSVGASLNAAATSITRVSGAGFAWPGPTESQTCAELVTTSTDTSGANYLLGTRTFTSGRTYRVRAALKRISGGTTARFRIGSTSNATDRSSATAFTITDDWAWYSADVTLTGDRTDMQVVITNGSAAALTVRIAAVEVYEAIDELNGDGGRYDVSSIGWTRSLTQTGTMNLVLHDPRDARRYTPWDTSGALYGLLAPGRKVWARAVHSTTLYPIGYGTIRRIVPLATEGTVQVLAEDPMYDFARASVTMSFDADSSYAEARSQLFGAGALAEGRDPIAGDRRLDLSTTNSEQATFYNGTNGDVSVADWLEQLNEATGTAHYVQPDARAEVLWRYTTVARSDLTDPESSDETVSDDFRMLAGADMTDETLENTQSVPFQGYEALKPPGWLAGATRLAQALDPTVYTTADPEDPYLHFREDRYGSDEGIVEPSYERAWHWEWHRIRRRHKKKRKRVRVRTTTYRRVYPDHFVPFTMAAGDVKEFSIDFSIPMATVTVTTSTSIYTDTQVTMVSPRQVDVRIVAMQATTIDQVLVTGYPYLATDEDSASHVDYEGVLTSGVRDGPSFNTPYIPSKGAAEGIGAHRNWRYGEARMRPTLTVQHRFPGILKRRPAEHLTVTGELFSVDGMVFVINKVTGSVDTKGRLWQADYDLEELPTSPGPLFTLGTSALGGTDVLAL